MTGDDKDCTKCDAFKALFAENERLNRIVGNLSIAVNEMTKYVESVKTPPVHEIYSMFIECSEGTVVNSETLRIMALWLSEFYDMNTSEII